MKIDERWDGQYNKIMRFMHENKRRPSKYRPEEHGMVNWIKFNKRQFKRGIMYQSREERFQALLALAEHYRRINQFSYVREGIE